MVDQSPLSALDIDSPRSEVLPWIGPSSACGKLQLARKHAIRPPAAVMMPPTNPKA